MSTGTESAVLETRHAEHLANSAIDSDIIEHRGYRTATGKPELLELEPQFSKTQRRVPALVFPIYRLGEAKPYTYVSRPDNPRTRDGKPVKYEWPEGVTNCLDILPRYRERLTDPTMTLLFTEGAKKADAAASLGAFLPVNLNGVYGWRGRGKAGGKALLADLEYIALEARRVILAFDSDFQTNRQIRQSLERLAAVLQRKGAEVHILTLPTAADGSKTGLDDFLATLPEGDRLRRVEELITLYEGGGGMSKAYTHPVTLEDLYHPPNWHMQGDALLYTDPRTEAVTVVYPGNITVTALGYDLESQQETATVSFLVRGERRTVTAPRQELAKARGLVELLAARGAAVHDGNARRLAGYLTEFSSLNDQAMPYTPHISRLGLVGEGLVTPGGSVGTEARYEGERSAKLGKDAAAYPRALQEVLTWSGDLWPFWLTLGAALASPAIARLQLRRSPVIYLSGSSGAGKTTTAQFSIGAWSDPTALPFHIEAPRTTQAGYLQTLSEAGGLPVLIDEVHAAARKDIIEATVYQFANGMSYTKGRVDGRPAGGELLHGAVILAGEAVVEFQNAGAARRVLYLPADTCPPLGAEPYSETGAARARVLEAAWQGGAGLLGPRVAEAIWNDWEGFTELVSKLEATLAAPCDDEGRKRPSLGAWAGSVAAITATLGVLFEVLELEPPESLEALELRVSEALEAAEAVDPAALAFEAVLSLVALAKHEGHEGRLNGELVAWKAAENGTDDYWYIPTGSNAFRERVGASAVQLHGKAWQARGQIEHDKEGKSTQSVKSPESKIAVRALKLLKHEP